MQSSPGILDAVASTSGDLGGRGASRSSAGAAADTSFSDALDGHVKAMSQDSTDSPDGPQDKGPSAATGEAAKNAAHAKDANKKQADGDGADDASAAEKSGEENSPAAQKSAEKSADSADNKGGKSDKKQAKDGKDLPLTLPLATAESKTAKSKATQDVAPAKTAKTSASVGEVISQALNKAGKGEGTAKGEVSATDTGRFLKHLQQDMAQLHKPLQALTAVQGKGAPAKALLRDLGASAPKDLMAATQALSGGSATPTSAASGGTGAAAPAPQQPTSMTLAQPMNQPGWNKAFNERMLMMVKEGVQNARLELNPKHLGPIEVRMSVHQDQASVAFTAHHAATREALEQAMPRLREMMQQSGLNLAQSHVGDYSSGQPQNHNGTHSGAGRGGNGGVAGIGDLGEGDAVHEVSLPRLGNSAVDYYA